MNRPPAASRLGRTGRQPEIAGQFRAPDPKASATLRTGRYRGLVSILKTIQHDPRVGKCRWSRLICREHRVLYRQETADRIDFPALGRRLQTMKLGTVNVPKSG